MKEKRGWKNIGARASAIFPKKNHRGQVTIFIILAIIIVALGFLIYSFYPQIKSSLGAPEQNPQGFIQSCIEDDIKNAVSELSPQGGSINPQHYLMYQDNKIEYLCYTNEYYKPCTVQQPLLKQHIQTEIKNAIDKKVDACFNSLKQNYIKKGYDVQLTPGSKNVELLPKRIVSTFNYSLTLTKGSTQKYNPFSVVLNNNLYELSSIANSIIEWETLYGDAETTTYMIYYHDLKVEKILRENDGKIYVLTDRNTGNKFEFAIRGQILPAGYRILTA